MIRRKATTSSSPVINALWIRDLTTLTGKKLFRAVMEAAWDLARRGAKAFGGSSKDYIASAMQAAWAVAKAAQASKPAAVTLCLTAQKLIDLGMKVWNESRIYVSSQHMEAVFGLHYSNGNSHLNGEPLSNNKAFKLHTATVYFDIKAERFVGTELAAII